MIIRRLEDTQADAVAIGLFLRETFAGEHQFGSMKTESINLDRSWGHITRILANGAAWVTEDDSGVVGSISVEPKSLWWTDRRYLSDGWFYVRPEKRASRAAVMLLKTAGEYAHEAGLPLCITVFNADDIPRKEAFFERMGFAPLGGLFIKET